MIRRMAIAVLCVGGLFVSAYLWMFKLGLMGTIACGSGGCVTVQLSPYSEFLGIDVALLGLLGFGAMLGLALASGFGISPRVEAMQREIGGSVAALPDSDPRRASFYQLHGLSNLLLSATMVGALLLVIWESREGS